MRESAPATIGELIDFESFAPGTVVSTAFGTQGSGPILINGLNTAFPAGTNAAVVFDSANPTGGDLDLGTPGISFGGPGRGAGGFSTAPFPNALPQGNVLIIAEDLVDGNGDGLIDDPDDADVDGAMLQFDFSAIGPVTICRMRVVDVEADEPNGFVEFFDQSGTMINLVSIPTLGDNGAVTLNVFTQGVYSMNVNLNGSGCVDDIDFVRANSIGDTVFCDLNDNGVQDANEPGLGGVTVNLLCAGLDGVLGTADDTTDSQVTDANGIYLFTDVSSTPCVVSVDASTAPDDKELGSCPDTLNLNLAPGEVFLDADFCFTNKDAAIGDEVWCDTNNNGVRDAGEPGIAGVGVDLLCAGPDGNFGTADDISASTTTDANGFYLFTGIATPDTCRVTVDVASAPADKELGLCPPSVDVSLAPGDLFLGADFCFKNKDASIGDLVWCDTNNNGVRDAGEPGIAGVTVLLACAGPDGTLGTADDFTASTVTGANGNYLFSGIAAPDACVVSLDLSTIPADKEVGVCPTSQNVSVQPGVADLSADFCLKNKDASIGDLVWCDTDNDGVFDAGEPGIAGVTVLLACAGPDGMLGTADDVTASTVTDANGNYLFSGIAAPDNCVVSLDLSTIPADKEVGVCPTSRNVSVQPGVADLSADFCLKNKDASIGDLVWCDTDNDGVFDAGEPGIAGVTVNLICAGPDGTLGTADDITASTVTDANGNYLFSGLSAPDNCVVSLDLTTIPDDKEVGVCPTSLNVNLLPGSANLDADFCLRNKDASIGDLVWCDTNNDGVRDAGEPGIPGVTLNLACAGPDGVLGTADDYTDSTTTNINGRYWFSNVPAPDDCVVSLDLTSIPADKEVGVCPTSVNVSVAPGDLNLDADFCLKNKDATIGDLVWCDTNNDGIFDAGEPGIEGVVLNLLCDGPDGIFGTADDFTATTTTDASGAYLFSNVPAPGRCVVSVDLTSIPDDKEVGACPTTRNAPLQPGVMFLGADFCFKNKEASIGDLVWCDTDNDGVFDAGEPGIAGVTVNLVCAGPDGTLGTADDITDSTVTDASGNYLFDGIVAPDTCVVSVDLSTIPADKEVGACPTSLSVDVAAGSANLDVDFCFKNQDASIGDLVWCDTDNDGVFDAGEPGIAGVTINLACAGPDGILGTADDITSSTVTDANGNYLFSGIAAPDDCVVSVDLSTIPVDKEVGACPTSLDVSVLPGSSNLDADFCFKNQEASVGDLVWCDTNDNGVFDAGEPGIAGVTVNLACAGPDGTLGTADDFTASTVTDASGNYLFSGVPAPDTCVVSVDLASLPADKAVGSCPTSLKLLLAAGQNYLDADFCFINNTAEIGDLVWCDTNDNGVFDMGEPIIAGAKVDLVCAGPDGVIGTGDDYVDSTTTDSSGNYLFTGITAPDDCRVSVDLSSVPAGKVPGSCPTSVDVSLLPGDSFLDADFCFVEIEDYCPVAAVADPNCSSSTTPHNLFLPGIVNGNVMVFVNAGEFKFLPDGTATYEGILANPSDSDEAFYMFVTFSQRVDPGDANYPPANSPKTGPCTTDTSDYIYFEQTDGFLVGLDDFTGAQVQFTRRGEAFQIGDGANLKNSLFGASGWFDWVTIEDPDYGSFPSSGVGDINIDLMAGLCPCTEPYEASSPGPWSVTTGSVYADFDGVGAGDYDTVDMTLEFNDNYSLLIKGTASGPLGTVEVVLVNTVNIDSWDLRSYDGSNDFGTMTHLESGEVIELTGLSNGSFAAEFVTQVAGSSAIYDAWWQDRDYNGPDRLELTLYAAPECPSQTASSVSGSSNSGRGTWHLPGGAESVWVNGFSFGSSAFTPVDLNITSDGNGSVRLRGTAVGAQGTLRLDLTNQAVQSGDGVLIESVSFGSGTLFHVETGELLRLQADATSGPALLFDSLEVGAGDYMSRWVNAQDGSSSVLIHGQAAGGKSPRVQAKPGALPRKR